MSDVQRKDMRLLIAGVIILIIAVIHIGAIFVGPAAFDYLDAPQLGDYMRKGMYLFPIALTLCVTTAFLVFAAYALSGAGIIRPLPKLRSGLLIIGSIFSLRGLAVIWFIYLVLIDSPESIPREIGFSTVSLVLGILILLGGFAVKKPSEAQ